MNGAFAGDIGDFGKLGLLRWLADHDPAHHRFGVAWWATPPNPSLFRSRPRRFLLRHQEALQACDPALVAGLAELNQHYLGPTGSVAHMPQIVDLHRLLPAASLVSTEVVPRTSSGRESYVDRVLADVGEARVLLVDPDNGIALDERATAPQLRRTDQFVFVRELAALYAKGKRTLVVYDHLDRRHGGGIERARERVRWLEHYLKQRTVVVLQFHRVVARHYFVVPAAGHETWIRETIRQLLLDRGWGASFRPPHFTRVELSQ